MVTEAGLDPLQMILVGTVLELSVFLFEVPTGVVADLVSRRLSVIIGHIGVGLGFLIMALFPSFTMLLVSSFVWGTAYTFISGALPAWLSSEIGKEKTSAAFLRGSQFSHGAGFVGIVVAVLLAHYSMAAAIAVGAVSFIALGLTMIVLMQETNFKPTGDADRDTWHNMALTFNQGVTEVRTRPILVIVLGITFLFGMFSEGLDRLYTPLLIESFELPAVGALDGVVWWGIIAAVSQLLGLAATTIARKTVKLSDVNTLTWILSAALLGVAASVLMLAWAGTLAAMLTFYWISSACRSVYGPLMSGWLNRLLPEHGKATLFSMYGQADAVGQTIGGPLVGVVAKTFGIPVGLTLSAALLLPSTPLFRSAQKKLVA